MDFEPDTVQQSGSGSMFGGASAGNVRPATGSTGITVTVDLSSMGRTKTYPVTMQQNQYSYISFTANVPIDGGQAYGTYTLQATATDQQGNQATAPISLQVTNQQTDAQLDLTTTQQGDHVITNGWHVINGGENYTQYSTLTLDGQDALYPYSDKSIVCGLSLNANGAITDASGGEGEQWYGPPNWTLQR